MERIVFAQGWESYFEQNGIKLFDDFYYREANLKVLNHKKRCVNSVTIGEGAQQKTFFIKRFGYCHLTDIILSLHNFMQICSQSACEYRNANFLLEKGFGTYRPVCFGERTIGGIEQKSFVVTEKLGGESLDKYVAANFEHLERIEKEKILKSLGQMIRRIHDCDISLPDLYIWHLFITAKDGDYEFAVIDLHRMKYKVKSQNEKIKNLGRLDYSLRDEYFDEGLRRALIEGYDQKESDLLFKQIRRRSARLSKRRKTKRYTKKL